MLDARAVATVRTLVDRYRTQCLWFLRRDYYPRTAEEAERVLRLIEQHGDLEAARQVAATRRWLSHPSNAVSAGS